MSKLGENIQAIFRSPFLWGIFGAIGFYALIHGGPLNTPLMKRYFTLHPVLYMETVIFAIGLASLIVKAFDVLGQKVQLKESLFATVPRDARPIDQCNALLARLDRLPGRRQAEYYVRRLRAALEHIRHRGSADALDDELKYLADLDAVRSHNGYALFRVIVWAIPILGFLGTVIGITMALNSVDLKSPDESMLEVLNGLGLKFDTTALALTLAMALMFVHYYVERAESSLLEAVDRRVQTELSERFTSLAPAGNDGQLVAIHRITEAMLQAAEGMARRQSELWRTSVESAAEQWSQMARSAGDHVRKALAEATAELTQRAEVLERAVAAVGEITKLETALNQNLAGLAGAKHFEQTVMSLAAAVNLLSARLTDAPVAIAPVKLEPARRSSHAA